MTATAVTSPIEIRSSALEAIMRHACDARPHECCGLLVGTSSLIERSERARNLRPSATRFLIDPADHFASIRSARAEGLTVMGVYHSHPHSSPTPSRTDLAEATDPGLLYVIVAPSLAGSSDERVGAFRLVGTRFRRVLLLVVNDASMPTAT